MKKIVLIHGYTETPAIWENLDIENPFSDTFVIVNANDNFESKDSIYEVANDILGSCEASDQLVVIGHSMGGYIGLEMLHQDPKKIRALMLMNSHPFGDKPEKKEQRMASIQLMKEVGKNKFLERTIPSLFIKGADRSKIDNNIVLAKTITEKAIQNELTAMANRKDFGDFFESSFVLKSMYLGKEDPLMNYSELLDYTAKIDNICLYLDEKAGHMSYAENPVHLRQSLFDFLQICEREI